jgi:hypothetical protein
VTQPSFTAQRDQLRRGHFIRVVNYHSTPRVARDELARELAGFARDYAPVTLDDLDRLFETGTWHKDKPGLIPVFYEGYRNSATVAAPLCDEYGLTGWFPIATSFVDCDPEYQEAFARAHWISLVEEDTQGGRIAMNWDEVRDLSERHVVDPPRQLTGSGPGPAPVRPGLGPSPRSRDHAGAHRTSTTSWGSRSLPMTRSSGRKPSAKYGSPAPSTTGW